MIEEQKPKKSRGKSKPFGPAEAREDVLAKLETAGAKGKPGFVTAKTTPAKGEAYETALAALEDEKLIFVDRSKAKPKYYLAEYRPQGPSPEAVAEKMAALAASTHPGILGATELKKALAAKEKTLFAAAVTLLLGGGTFLVLRSGKKELYLHLPSVRVAGSAVVEKVPERAEGQIDEAAIRSAYERLVAQTRFPAVEIAALQQMAGLPLSSLQPWLLQEYHAGRAVLSAGDWSLSDESTRAAAIHDRGERFLLVRFSSERDA
ncbi:MAG: hypothetical protein ACO1QR_16635 [Chthoniobacteraceae bacterium]